MVSDWRRTPGPGLLVMILAVLAFEPVHGQTLTTGALGGRILDETGRPVLEAIVTAREAAADLGQETDTGRRGVFSFGFLAPGEYELTVEQIGFAPRRLTGIQVRPGRSHAMTIRLRSVASAAVQQDVERFGGAVVPASLYGGSQWLPPFTARSVPSAARESGDLLRMASMADDRWSVEGLPANLSVLLVDGIPFRPVAHPQLRARGPAAAAFALTGIESAELVTNGVDIEWAGAAASYLSAQTRRGAAGTAMHGAAFWSGDALPSGVTSGTGSLSHNDLQGGVVVRGPLFGAGNRFSFGVEARRLETPFSPAWSDTDAAAALIAGDTLGLNLESYSRPAVVARDAVAAFARADWSAGARHRVELSAHFAAQPGSAALDASGSQLPYDGNDLLAGAALRSRLSADVANELRIAVTRSARERTAAAQVAATRLVSEELAFGAATATASSADELILRVSDALHVPYGTHAIEIGGAAALGSYRYEHGEAANGMYLFGDLADFESGTGVFARAEGPAPLADWRSTTLSLFARDRWRAAPGLEVLLGVRLDRESLPESEVQRDGEWFRLTGLANNEAQAGSLRISPRAGITWDVNGSSDWKVEAGGGFYYDRVDPQLLAQWQIDDGDVRVRRAAGALNWPDDAATGATAPRLTMLGDDFEAPRTARLGAGVTRRLASGTDLYLSGVARRTVNLPRQSDLNLLQLPSARDQYGREVYGALEQHGGLLTAVPGSGRRFQSYDEVAFISADGWSDYRGVTIGLDRELMEGYGFLLRYTYGRTTDNWIDAAAGGWGRAAPSEAAGDPDQAEGTSDFDVPHRATAAIVVDAPLGIRLSGAYRFQSGRPFTPGFRAGVDADAAGGGTDPAYIDPTLPGMDALVGEWDCLSAAQDRFAERNSCRASPVHALDLSAALTLFRRGSRSASVIIDAFNVFDTWHEQPDAALYLIDAAGSLEVDPVARTVAVPLIVNPDFGKPLVRRHTGRQLRLGLSLNW
jgi:hypothetical protein